MDTSCLVVDLKNNNLKDKLTHAPIRTALLQPGVKAKLQGLFSTKRNPNLNDNSYLVKNMPSLRATQEKQDERLKEIAIENLVRYIVTTPTQEELIAQVRSSKAVLIHMNHVGFMIDIVLKNFQVDVFTESVRDTPYLLIQQR